jgi:Zn-dependent protease with chaperone function
MTRYLWADVAAILVAWTGLAFAVWMAGLNAIFGAANAATKTGSAAGSVYTGFAPIAGLFGGVGIGVSDFISTLVSIYSHELVTGAPTIVGLIIGGVLLSIVLLIAAIVEERFVLALQGARRLSERERELLMPLMEEVKRAMELPSIPPLWIDDRHQMGAWAHTRHIVISKAFLSPDVRGFNLVDRNGLCGVLAHELHHWRKGDSISLAFLQACALPVAVLCEFAPTNGFTMFILWPFYALTKFFIAPIFGKLSRNYEYEADDAANRAGYGLALAGVLQLIGQLEPARGGWEQVVNGTHPPTEFRIERLLHPHAQEFDYLYRGAPLVATPGLTDADYLLIKEPADSSR